MSQQQTAPAPSILDLKQQLDQRAFEFKAALPAHVTPERFIRVILTAIQNNPDLLRCDRRSLLTAAMKAAQDGLLPDSREGAFIAFRDRERGEVAQWLPMIAGLRKKARQSGEITTWECHVVHQHDIFDYELGDKPSIKHRPAVGDRGAPIAAYSIAKLKGGEISREVMSIQEINSICARSRAKDNGPWATDFGEMARKTVARRHAKVLPTSNDLDVVLRRDDDLYEFSLSAPQEPSNEPEARNFITLQQKLDRLASNDDTRARLQPPQRHASFANNQSVAPSPDHRRGK